MRNEYAWSPRGKFVNDERKGHATEKLNIIAGLSGGNIVAPMIYECSTDAEIFNFWLEHSLLPEIPKNSLVVMDNANFHKSEKTKELVKKFSCRLLFLPVNSTCKCNFCLVVRKVSCGIMLAHFLPASKRSTDEKLDTTHRSRT